MSAGGPRRSERRFLLACFVLLAALTVWAVVAPLDVVSNAQGEVTPASRVKAIQHLEGGIVQDILVEEGALVKKGQPLIRLDPLRARAEFEELQKRLTGQRIDILRLTAEIDGLDAPAFSPALEQALPDLVAQARSLFTTRHKRLGHDLKAQENLIAQRQSEQRELTQRLASTRKTLDIVASEVSISANLLRNDLTSRMAHLEFLRQQQSLLTLIESDQNALPRTEAALSEARERMGSVREAFVEQARKDLAAAQQQVSELSQRAVRFENAEERTTLRAPVDGIVKTLAVATEGGVIQPGQIVAEIVPIEDRLIIEAQLPIQDISYVHPGQSVRVTMASPDAAAFGHLDGTVIRVSPDAVATQGNAAIGARSFYKVRIETNQNSFTMGNWHYLLYPGMQVQCSIRLGTRSVFEYLLSPWFQSLRFAFQER